MVTPFAAGLACSSHVYCMHVCTLIPRKQHGQTTPVSGGTLHFALTGYGMSISAAALCTLRLLAMAWVSNQRALGTPPSPLFCVTSWPRTRFLTPYTDLLTEGHSRHKGDNDHTHSIRFPSVVPRHSEKMGRGVQCQNGMIGSLARVRRPFSDPSHYVAKHQALRSVI